MFDRVVKDLTDAMKNKETFKLSVLRMLKSALKNEEINKKSPLTDDEVLSIIKKQVKTRKDSMNEYIGYNRMDLADNLQKEIDILSQYLPAELTDDELENIINSTIEELNADNIKQMGLVIKTISSKYGARCDMAKVSTIVKSKLMKD